jgi:glucan 1,3-beta-glucosidase
VPPAWNQAWDSTTVFWRQVANIAIDLTALTPTQAVSGIHWPTSQATSLQNVVFKMSQAAGTKHQGVYIENGSGGYIGDLVFYGGNVGMLIGNQ